MLENLENSPSADDLDRQLAADEASRSQPEPKAEPKPEPVKQSEPPAQEEPETQEADDKADDKAKESEEELHRRLARLNYAEREARKQAKALAEENARLRGQAPPLSRDEELDKQVEERAKQKVYWDDYVKKTEDVYKQGVAKYPNFHEAVTTFNTELGQMPIPLVEAAMDTGEAAKVLHYLGTNLDEAERIMNLSPAKMGVALAKIASKSEKTAAPLSKAPDPIRPIAGSVKADVNPDRMSMDEYVKWQDRHDMERKKNKW